MNPTPKSTRGRADYTRRSYASPPVVEALVEVFFAGSTWDLAVPGQFFERVRHDYPRRADIDHVQVEMSSGGSAAEMKLTPRAPRIRFESESGNRIVQVSQDLLVINQLRPYPPFQDWRPEVARMLDIYAELASPPGVVRIGTRYINKIEVPGPTVRLEDYFHLYPEVPEALGSPHGPFLLRVQSQPPRHPSHVLLTTFSTSEGDEKAMGFLLDLYDQRVLAKPEPLSVVDTIVEEAHENIEVSFESSITDLSRKLFEEIR